MVPFMLDKHTWYDTEETITAIDWLFVEKHGMGMYYTLQIDVFVTG